MPSPLVQTLKTLPKKSGIYQYYDEKGVLLYVGKAKNLHNRVRSYFRVTDATPSSNLSPRIHNMILKVASIQTIIVDSEMDALILENSLIKQLKPRYNILLRDDKTYPYIYIDTASPFPRPKITRIKRKSCIYFGPFCTGSKELLESLYEVVPLVQKEGCLREKKACLFYQINRCLAPCEGKITQEEYQKLLTQAINYLKDKKSLITKLEEKMLRVAEQERFEEAITLRERIKKISSLSMHSQIDSHTQDANWDIFALEHNAKYAVLMKLYMREGKIISSDYEKIILHQKSLEFEERISLYRQALVNHYGKDLPLPPSAIILPSEIEGELEECQEWLTIKLVFPKKGEKKALVELASKNAKEILKIEDSEYEIKQGLKELFSLHTLPHRIEVFDTSHHAGENNVGAMVVYEEGKFIKDSYRMYHLEGSDEYSQMREMLVRRAKDFEKTSPPDLWLLDGGKAQIHIAQEVLESVGVELEVIAIAKEKLDHKAHRAKGKARDILRAYVEGEYKEMRLLPSDTRLQYFQKLRDEAHRFAIKFHREKKLKGFIPRG
ncbi:excinuclease ABC subunit UvrC [Helicobacter brantae]|uniref:Excinuclease ABC subunit C n=1 Tax=Helicobacter brantae TaxID=375927 RepID=A0A3D8J0D8_9HELI|nr:excinuclease ABC subunit UvrC [Helicobacter brantae]RDU70958.1 excinuclease ABC subunit C [Helicobacter brantae]